MDVARGYEPQIRTVIRGSGSGKREVAEKIREPFPDEALSLAPTAEPFVPGPLRLFEDEQQTSEVAAHREVVEVALDTPREPFVLNRDRNMLPEQPGDMKAASADVSALVEAVGYRPKISLEEGMDRFVRWYREFYGV